MSEVLTVEAPKIKRVTGKVTIKSYLSGEEAMGREKYDEALFPGTYQIDRIGMYERNGNKTYITGLDEQAMEVQTLAGDKKKGKIKAIREAVAFLENRLANNFEVNPDSCMEGYGTKDDIFWKNVKMFISSAPDKYDPKGNRAETYWDKVELKMDNDGRELNLKDPHDLVIFYAIEAGGLSMVAPSLSVAIEQPGYNFYLDQPEETAAIRTESKKLKAKAFGYLDNMMNLDHSKLFYMTKVMVPSGSSQYRRGGAASTPNDVLYDDLFNCIEGKAGDDSKISIERFLSFYDMPTEELNKRAIIKDATEVHLIDVRGDGFLYYTRKNAKLGKTVEEIIEYLKNPMNSTIWDDLREGVEEFWAN